MFPTVTSIDIEHQYARLLKYLFWWPNIAFIDVLNLHPYLLFLVLLIHRTNLTSKSICPFHKRFMLYRKKVHRKIWTMNAFLEDIAIKCSGRTLYRNKHVKFVFYVASIFWRLGKEYECRSWMTSNLYQQFCRIESTINIITAIIAGIKELCYKYPQSSKAPIKAVQKKTNFNNSGSDSSRELYCSTHEYKGSAHDASREERPAEKCQQRQPHLLPREEATT